MICNFSNWDRKWLSYQGTEWRPTQSPFPWGSCPALGSCLGAGDDPGLVGLALPVSSSGPDRSPPCRGPSLCCWGHRTSHTQDAPSTENMSADLNSFGLKKKKKERNKIKKIKNTENIKDKTSALQFWPVSSWHFISQIWRIFIWWWILTVRSVNNLQGCCFKDFILQEFGFDTMSDLRKASSIFNPVIASAVRGIGIRAGEIQELRHSRVDREGEMSQNETEKSVKKSQETCCNSRQPQWNL